VKHFIPEKSIEKRDTIHDKGYPWNVGYSVDYPLSQNKLFSTPALSHTPSSSLSKPIGYYLVV
jgi:hypothetical protein